MNFVFPWAALTLLGVLAGTDVTGSLAQRTLYLGPLVLIFLVCAARRLRVRVVVARDEVCIVNFFSAHHVPRQEIVDLVVRRSRAGNYYGTFLSARGDARTASALYKPRGGLVRAKTNLDAVVGQIRDALGLATL